MKLYSNNCPNCKTTKNVLINKGLEYQEINDMKDIIEVAQREQLTVMPLLEIDGVFYSGIEAINKAKEL